MIHPLKTASYLAARALAIGLDRLSAAERDSIARLTGRDLTARQAVAFAGFAKALSGGARTDPEATGELELIERTACFPFVVAFDVGANVGDWSGHFRSVHPLATVHCFEIVPETFARLRARFASDTAPVLNSFGLADENAEAEVFVSDDDLAASLYERADGLAKRKQASRVERGTYYARGCGIEQIDFLKIDVEGAEGRVLLGLAEYFDQRRVRLVQFEYNQFAIESHFLLIDFYRFLTSRGYAIGRLTPAGVIFVGEYRYALEGSWGNYVACRQDDLALIAAIACG